jgi:hypothetical protein
MFIMFVPLGGACFLMSLFVDDKGLPDDGPKAEGKASPAPGDTVSDSEDDTTRSRSGSEILLQIPVGENTKLDSKEKAKDKKGVEVKEEKTS